MEIKQFKERLHALLTEPETADLPDAEWWERFGEALDEILGARARARRDEREVNRCTATSEGGVVRCVRPRHDVENHFNPTVGQWTS